MSQLLLIAIALSPIQQAGRWAVRSEMLGPEPGSDFASAMAVISDLDGDGVQDLLIGNHDSDWVGTNRGAVHAFSGATGQRLYSVSGSFWGEGFGTGISRAGDVDADGTEDFIVGSPQANFFGTVEGGVYIYSGARGTLLTFLPGVPGIGHGDFGSGLSAIGDYNRDGVDDFAVGDPGTSILPNSNGFFWIISGADFSVLETIARDGWGTGGTILGLSDLTGDGRREIMLKVNLDVVILSGSDLSEIRRHVFFDRWQNFGAAMTEVGDLDLDGVSDYAIGAPAFFARRSRGHVYVYSGATGAELAVLEGNDRASDFGWTLAGPGDVDGDGYPEILVGAWLQDINGGLEAWGAAHLFSGYDFQRTHVFMQDGWRIHHVGYSVAPAGDVNGDGLMEFHIGSNSTHHQVGYGGVSRCYGLNSFLQPSTRSVSATVGGAVDFAVDFPDSVGGLRYAILASTGPGRTLIRGERIPLNATPLLNLSLNAPPAFFPGAQGTLDPSGDASATLTLAPHAATAWAGRTLKFSAVALDPTGAVQAYSAAMPLAVEP